MSNQAVIPPHNKLTITINYGDKSEMNKLLDRVKFLVWKDSVCHQDQFAGGRYSFTVEDLSEVNILSDFNIMEEPDIIEVTPKIEIINGKTCHIYVSKMNFNVHN